MDSIQRVITTTILAQLLVENVDGLEQEYPAIFKHGFKQKGKLFTKECEHVLKEILSPLTDEQQILMWKQIETMQKEFGTLLSHINKPDSDGSNNVS